MAKTQKRGIGDIGEGVAQKYLENNRFFVLSRNYWKPWGEIDIVAERDHMLHFVEVKSVSVKGSDGKFSRETIRPEENMHPAKLRRLHRVVQTYLIEEKVPENKEWQIDLVCVFLNFETKRAKVEMFENIII